MLALQTRMEPLRASHTFTSDAPDLLRQPSAEDLDAAHQLVSSARGRNGDYSGHERRHSTLSNDMPPRVEAESEEEVGRQQGQARDSVRGAQDDTVNLGQICRYVHPHASLDSTTSLFDIRLPWRASLCFFGNGLAG